MLVFNDTEEKSVEKVIAALDNIITLEVLQPPHSPAMIFPGLEIRQSQHRVLQGGEDINLTRLEYSTLVFLASNPGIVLTQEQIFEAVWNMDGTIQISGTEYVWELTTMIPGKSCLKNDSFFQVSGQPQGTYSIYGFCSQSVKLFKSQLTKQLNHAII